MSKLEFARVMQTQADELVRIFQTSLSTAKRNGRLIAQIESVGGRGGPAIYQIQVLLSEAGLKTELHANGRKKRPMAARRNETFQDKTIRRSNQAAGAVQRPLLRRVRNQ